jgi:hypothetical protein
MKQRSYGCFTITLLILSVLFLGGTVFLSFRTLNEWQYSTRTSGVVIENAVETSDEGEMYRPKILFFDAQNDSVIFSARFQSSFYLFDVGEKVDVLYLPDKAISDTFTERWAGISLLGLFGGCGLAFAVFLMRFGRKEKRRVEQLIKSGYKVPARITEIVRIQGSEDTTASLFIFCEAQIGGVTHKFTSDPIYKDTTSLKTGDEVTVYYEHRHPKNYIVSLPVDLKQ